MRTLLLLVVISFYSCKNDKEQSTFTSEVNINPEVEYDAEPLIEYDFEGLKPLLETDTDTIYIVNFWATWCAPCVKELPYFEAINKEYRDKKVRVLLVSLDFPKKYDTHVKPFVKKHGLKSKVIALNDMDSNTWIPAISPEWSGAIPATLIFNKDKRAFYEKTFTYEELQTELNKFL